MPVAVLQLILLRSKRPRLAVIGRFDHRDKARSFHVLQFCWAAATTGDRYSTSVTFNESRVPGALSPHRVVIPPLARRIRCSALSSRPRLASTIDPMTAECETITTLPAG